MLPDYPELKNRIRELYVELMKVHRKQFFPLQGMVKQSIIQEGTNPEYQTEFKGVIENEVMNIMKYESKATFQKKELFKMSLGQVLDKFLEAAHEIGENVELSSIKEISDSLDRKGQTTTVSKDITPDDIIRAIESVSISFDEHGKANLPTIMGSPETIDKFQESFILLDQEPYRSRLNEVIEIKKRDWNDREASRKLVD